MQTKETGADSDTCTNPWHAGVSLGAQFFPACPSCGLEYVARGTSKEVLAPFLRDAGAK